MKKHDVVDGPAVAPSFAHSHIADIERPDAFMAALLRHVGGGKGET